MRPMWNHHLKLLAVMLLACSMAGSSALRAEDLVAESLRGCRWSSHWKEIPEAASADAKKPSRPKKARDVTPKWPKDKTGRTGGGMPVVEAVVDAHGAVIDARIVHRPEWKLKAWPELDEAILDAVRQWEYEPAQLDGEAVPACLTVEVNIHWR
jgi:TonB family protein